MRDALDDLFDEDLAAGAVRTRTATGTRTAVQEMDLGRDVELGVVDLSEDIRKGQSVSGYRVEGLTADGWRTLTHGITIGYRKLDRFRPVSVRRVRVHVEDGWEAPREVGVALYRGD
jgi:alpha-L-fucosidase